MIPLFTNRCFQTLSVLFILCWLVFQLGACASDSYTARGAKQGATTGAVAVDTGSGHITVADVRGELHLDTGSGHVEVDGVLGDLSVDTGSGHVDAVGISQAKKIHVDTGSGHVQLTRATGDDVEVDTGSGNVDLDEIVASSITVDTGSGRVEGRDPPASQDAARAMAADRRAAARHEQQRPVRVAPDHPGQGGVGLLVDRIVAGRTASAELGRGG